jgi:hypothetical protein
LRRRVQEIRDLQHGFSRIQDAEIDHGVYLHRYVVTRDDILRRHFHGLNSERDAHDSVDRSEHQDDAWSFGMRQHAAQAEDHAALIFSQDLDGRQQVDYDNHQRNYDSQIGHGNLGKAISLYTALRLHARRRSLIKESPHAHSTVSGLRQRP